MMIAIMLVEFVNVALSSFRLGSEGCGCKVASRRIPMKISRIPRKVTPNPNRFRLVCLS